MPSDEPLRTGRNPLRATTHQYGQLRLNVRHKLEDTTVLQRTRLERLNLEYVAVPRCTSLELRNPKHIIVLRRTGMKFPTLGTS